MHFRYLGSAINLNNHKNMKLTILIVFIELALSIETCSKNDGECVSSKTTLYNEGKNNFFYKMSNEYKLNVMISADNKYIGEISKALADFTPCNQTGCNCHANTITEDLKPFRAGISRDMVRSVADRGTKYQIIGHKLYRQKTCMFPSRCSGIEHFIKANLQHIPDLEMIVNCRDWPQINRHWGIGGPVFSFSKTAEYADIMYPTWSFWEGGPAISLYPTGLGRWDQHRERISSVANDFEWTTKSNLAFFRGSRTSAERDSLVLLSRANPDVADAKYTKNQAWKSSADTLNAEPAPEVYLEDHCRYKYLFNFRGVAASFRFKHLFLCRSLVFHVGEEWQEFFYPEMRPWVHYVPVKVDPSAEELHSLIEFFRRHDDLARQIADRGFQHIWDNLELKHVHCYWRRLLRRYAKLLRYDVVRDTDLIAI